MSDIVMRLRAVLAGFVDMTPDDVATTAQQVADEFLRERKRREELERRCRDFDEHVKHISQCWADDTRRAEQAERERDEWKAANDLSVQRWQRAEADNAALLQRSERVVEKAASYDHAESCFYAEGDETEDPSPCTCSVGLAELAGVATTSHPGAALLERMRALEEVADRMAALAMHDEACQSDVSGARDPSNCALCEYNTLKPETK